MRRVGIPPLFCPGVEQAGMTILATDQWLAAQSVAGDALERLARVLEF
jgi:hypothetical protein